MSKRNPGWFREGFDPRRHVLSRAERQKGFQLATQFYPMPSRAGLAAEHNPRLLPAKGQRMSGNDHPPTVRVYRVVWRDRNGILHTSAPFLMEEKARRWANLLRRDPAGRGRRKPDSPEAICLRAMGVPRKPVTRPPRPWG
jgi:hypothetical protein